MHPVLEQMKFSNFSFCTLSQAYILLLNVWTDRKLSNRNIAFNICTCVSSCDSEQYVLLALLATVFALKSQFYMQFHYAFKMEFDMTFIQSAEFTPFTLFHSSIYYSMCAFNMFS